MYQLHHYSNDYAGDEALLDSRAAIATNLNIPLIMGAYGESDDSGMAFMTDWCVSNDVDYFPWSFKKMSKDRCLWTIQSNEPYEELKVFINNGTTPSSSLYDDMIAFAQNNIANGSSPELIFHQGWYDATKPPELDFVPDPTKTYYIDCPAHDLRLASSGSSEDAYTTSTSTTGDDVVWQFVDKANGNWYIDRAAGGLKARLHSDNSPQYADMQSTSSTGSYTYYEVILGENSGLIS